MVFKLTRLNNTISNKKKIKHPSNIASSNAGQAMVEFVVAVVCIMLVVGGILVVANLQRADAKSMLKASEEAIKDSSGNPLADNFTPIENWDNGADGYEQTKDDTAKKGSFSRLRNKVTSHAVPDDDWSAFNRADGNSVNYNGIRQINSSGSASAIGMIEREASETAEIPSIIQKALGYPEEVEVENSVWMPKTGGLY